MFARLVAYVRGIAGRRRIDTEVEDELRFHVDQEIAAHVARGVSPVEARRMALRDLGGLTQVTQAVHEVRTIWPRLALARRSSCRPFAATDAGLYERGPRGPDTEHRRDDRDLLRRGRSHPPGTAVPSRAIGLSPSASST